MSNTSYSSAFGLLRSACASAHIQDADDALKRILATQHHGESISALHYAMSHITSPPWRWAWWALFLEEGRTPTTHKNPKSNEFTL